MDVAEIVAREFGLGPVLDWTRATAGVMNLNWRLVTERGTYAVKLQRDGTPEQIRAVHGVLAQLDFRVPLPLPAPDGDTLLRVGDDWYSVFPWLPGTHPREGGLDLDACAAFGDMVGRMHLALARLCPPAPPTIMDVPAAGDELREYAELGPGDEFDLLAREQIAWRLDLLAELGEQRPAPGPVGPAGWTHGDLQPYNLLAENGRVTGVLDWDRLGVRTYGLEVVRTATITFSTGDQGAVDLARVAAFALAYRVHIKVSDAELADAAHRRWWVLATDPWPLDRHYRDGDTTCDHLFGRRGRALRWWTGHRAEVIAALTHR
ncbi:phosphotransferase [Paractinoplanes durhamensis]|nr:phosphotransferase [Actinoplanes durhamensis]